jgi:uncharacterized protein YutE (UPF0331/DUF86 family)
MNDRIDRATIENLFRNLDTYVGHLRTLGQLSRETLTEDPIKVGAAKYYLHVAIESCIDVANHLIARLRLRPPESYADSFAVLAENHIIKQDFATTAQRMVKMRNRLVHLYWEVDEDIVYDVLQNNLDDFRAFQQQIANFITQRRMGTEANEASKA